MPGPAHRSAPRSGLPRHLAAAGPWHSASVAILALAALAGTATAAEDEHAYQGMAVFNTTCTVCHWPGVGGAPRIGDRDAWAPRIARGRDLLYEHALRGYEGASGFMPARGGNWSLTDEQVRAAVDFIVSHSE